MLGRRPLDPVTDGAWLGGGAALVVGTERGVFVLSDDQAAPVQVTLPETSGGRGR